MHTKIFTLQLFFLSYISILAAQPLRVDYLKEAHTIDSYFQISDIDANEEGNLFLTGYFHSSFYFGPHKVGQGNADDYFVVKLDEQGDVAWSKTEWMPNDQRARSVTVDDNENSYVAGFAGEYFLRSYNKNGGQNWNKFFSSGSANIVKFNEANKSVILAGSFNDSMLLEPTKKMYASGGAGYFAELKTNSINFNWHKVIEGGGIYHIHNDYAGNIFLSVKPHTRIDTLIVDGIKIAAPYKLTAAVLKFNPHGEFMWHYVMGSNTGISYPLLATDSKGNVYLSGAYRDSLNVGNQVFLSVEQKNSPFLIKLDSLGNNPQYQVNTTDTGYISSILVDHRNRVYLSGSFLNKFTIGDSIIYSKKRLTHQAFLVELNENLKFKRAIMLNTKENDESSRLAGGKDNYIFMVGSTFNGDIIIGEDTIYDLHGRQIYIARINTSDNTTGINSVEIKEVFNIYPNPAHNKIQIDLSEIKGGMTTVYIYNSTGKLEKEKLLRQGLHAIDVSHLPSGLYIVKIVTERNTASKKIIIK